MWQKYTQSPKLSTTVLEVITCGWLCTEIGQFVQSHTTWGQNELFWPFWICLSLAVIMATKLLDTYTKRKH